MSRRALTLGLLLSVGVNLGVLGAVAAGRFADRGPSEPAAVGSGELSPSAVDGPEIAGRDRPGPGPGRWAAGVPGAPPVERLADRLGLEGETRERFLAVQRRWFESLLATRRERRRLTVELRSELAAARPDRVRIVDLVERLGEAYAAEEAATAAAVLDSRALLDPAQQETYGRFLRHLAERGGGRRGRKKIAPRLGAGREEG